MTIPVTTKSEVFERLRAHRVRLEALGVARIGVFGSFVNGNPGAESDVDLLVEFAPEKKTFLNWGNAWELTEEVLGRKVDFVSNDSLSPYLGPRILAEAEYVPITD